MIAGSIDYAALTTGITLEQLANLSLSDLLIFPVIGYAVIPGYNVSSHHCTRTLIRRQMS